MTVTANRKSVSLEAVSVALSDKQDAEETSSFFKKIKQLWLKPQDAFSYAGDEPLSRIYHVPLKVRFADMFWAIHGVPLWGTEKYIKLEDGIGYFDLITLLLFRFPISAMQWSYDMFFVCKLSDFKKPLWRFEVILEKIISVPLGISALSLHVFGNYMIRPVVSTFLTGLFTVIPVIFFAEYLAQKETEKLSKESVLEFDREIEVINTMPTPKVSAFSFNKKKELPQSTKLESLGQQLKEKHVDLKNCYLKRQVEFTNDFSETNYIISDNLDRAIATYPHNELTEKPFHQLAFNLFRLSPMQRKKIHDDENHPLQPEASLERRGGHRCTWF